MSESEHISGTPAAPSSGSAGKDKAAKRDKGCSDGHPNAPAQPHNVSRETLNKSGKSVGASASHEALSEPGETAETSASHETLNESGETAETSASHEALNGPGKTAETGVSHGASEAKKPASSPNDGDRGRKRSSVYLYLVVLFGAAFLMLLLAYFVQQRNNATLLDDLRSTTTASRQELLENIQLLEEENSQLSQKVDELQQREEELQQAYDEAWTANHQRQAELSDQIISWSLFWSMDSAYRAKDYDVCAGFFQNEFTSQTYATPTEAEERTEEIYQDLLRMGYLTEEDE